MLRVRDAWEEQKHPRGQPKNPGQFASGGGVSSSRSAPSEQPAPSAVKKTATPRKVKAESGTQAAKASAEASKARIDTIVAEYKSSNKTLVEERKAVKDIAHAVFEYMGIDKSVGYSTEWPRKFMVGDKQYETGGWFSPKDNVVTICTNTRPDNPGLPGLISHEAMHAKFEAVKKAYDLEDEKLFNDMVSERGGRKGVTAPDGKIRPEYQAEYPIHTVMPNGFGGNADTLRKDDGITDYSRAYWEAEATNSSDALLATNETLAEMARLDHEGSLPRLLWYKNSKSYKPLYEAIHKLYPTAVQMLQANSK